MKGELVFGARHHLSHPQTNAITQKMPAKILESSAASRVRWMRPFVLCSLVVSSVLCLCWIPPFGMQRPSKEPGLSICADANTAQAPGACRRRALDPSVWQSDAWVTFPRDGMSADEKKHERPLLCEFSNVYITAAHVYFLPHQHASQTATADISQCCGLGSDLASSCSGSVHSDLCFCFHNAKYVAFTWDGQSNEAVHMSLPGRTWLMHHWSVTRHPDHFSMKILELHGLVAARRARTKPHAQLLPPSFDNLLSMDYPGPLSAFTSYESFIYEILQRQTSSNRGYYFLNNEGGPYPALHNELFHAEALKYALYAVQPSTIPLQVAYVERAYMSPRYKNNLPEPVNVTASALQQTLHTMVGAEKRMCVDKLEPRTNITIAILYRDEGSGLRRFVNVNDMLLSIRRVVKESEIKIWFISSTTPAMDQAALFCSFHILISPHSSQLANLVFTPAGLSVIEIQNEELVENTFVQLGRKMNLHYQLLKTGNHPPINGSYAKTADVVVNITSFESAVVSAVHTVRSQGYVV